MKQYQLKPGGGFYFRGDSNNKSGFGKILKVDAGKVALRFTIRSKTDEPKIITVCKDEFIQREGQKYLTIEQYEDENDAILNHLTKPIAKKRIIQTHYE